MAFIETRGKVWVLKLIGELREGPLDEVADRVDKFALIDSLDRQKLGTCLRRPS